MRRPIKSHSSLYLVTIGTLLLADLCGAGSNGLVGNINVNPASGYTNNRVAGVGGGREPDIPVVASPLGSRRAALVAAVPVHRSVYPHGGHPQGGAPFVPFRAAMGPSLRPVLRRPLSGGAPPREPVPFGSLNPALMPYISAANVASGATSSASSTVAPALTEPKPLNMSEVCSQINVNVERQLTSYISGFEAITGTILELDEVVQQMRPRSCETRQVSANTSVSPQPFNTTGEPFVGSYSDQTLGPDRTASVPINAPMSEASATSDSIETFGQNFGSLTSTESFLDPPTAASGGSTTCLRTRRNSAPSSGAPFNGTSLFGRPVMMSGQASNSQDPTGEDLAKASDDLKTLRKDLSRAAEWLRQTNHTVHSAMLRALLTYVASIERRIDSQRQMYVTQTRDALLRSKVATIKEKMAALLDKLRSLIPSRSGTLSRDDPAPATNTLALASNIGPAPTPPGPVSTWRAAPISGGAISSSAGLTSGP